MRRKDRVPFSRSIRLGGLVLIVGVAATAGCAVGPDFRRPQVAVPDQWAEKSAGPAALTEKNLVHWWTVFQDPALASLVDRAVAANLDVQLAEARIREARASRGVAASGLGPTFDATGSFLRGQSAGATTSGTSGMGGAAGMRGAAVETRRPTTNQYQAGFDAGWELDLFGGVRRGVEAADADLAAAVESRRDVLVTLAAEVARNYIDLRAYQQRIAIAQGNLKAQRHSADLTRQRFEGGFVGGLDVANADALVATTASEIPLLESAARQTVYGLGVLLGREPAALMEELSAASAIPAGPPPVPVGVPSDLLRRRPDIRMAETQIHGATARIGVATADLFPKITLSGSIGWQATNSGRLFDPISRAWSFGPSVSWEVFNTGRNLANIEVQKALQEQAFLTYRQTVLVALQEVESALVASAKEEEHRRALVDAVAANRRAVGLASRLYVEGQTDFLSVLDAQRSLYASEDALVQSTGTVSTNLVAVYKALGGGWGGEAQEPVAPEGGAPRAAGP